MIANLTWFMQQISDTAWLSLALDLAIKASVILLATWVVSQTLRRASAATRHLAWTFAIVGLLALPILTATIPAWRLPMLPAAALASRSAPERTNTAIPLPQLARLEAPPAAQLVTRSDISQSKPATSFVEPEPAPDTSFSWTWPAGLFCIWLVGALLVLAPIPVGVFRLTRLAQRTRLPTSDSSWESLIRQLAEELRLARIVHLRWGKAASMPLTWGFLRSIVLLPEEAETWSIERRRLVMLHELAHVKRRDCLTQLTARLACAVYWFHPLAWLAARRLRLEREQACDDRVLETGARPSEYAWHLLDIARSHHSISHSAAVAISMARTSQLEGRLQAILDAGRERRSLGVGQAWAAACLAAILMLPLAALKPIAMAGPAVMPSITENESVAANSSTNDDAASQKSFIRVVVRDVAGKPVPGAKVLCVGAKVPKDDYGHRSALPISAQVRADGSPTMPEIVVLAEGKADADGLITLNVPRPPGDQKTALAMILCMAPSYGICGKHFTETPDSVTLTLRPEVKIRGQLLTPAGAPAKGVRVRLAHVMFAMDDGIGTTPGFQAPVPSYWPAEASTDAQGRFTIDGFSTDADASLMLIHPNFAQEDIHISSKPEVSDMNQGFDIKPYKPEFKHILEPARPVQGQITAADTKKPIAGVIVGVTAMGNHGGMPEWHEF